MVALRVILPLFVGGHTHGEGDVIQATEERAKLLIRLGLAERWQPPPNPPDAKRAKKAKS